MALDLFRVSGGLQINDSTQVLEGSAAPALDAPIGSLYTNTTTGGLYTKVLAGAGAGKWELLANNSFVTTEINSVNGRIDALGNAFNYVGVLAGGIQSAPTDLTLLAASGKDAGDYYKVTTAGWFTDGTNTFQTLVGDGLVWNTSGQIDKIDNTNSEVQGTANFVSVTGSTDAGYVVDLASGFKTRVSDAETAITGIDGRLTTAEGTLTTATGNITNLQTEVNNIETGVGLSATGTYTAPTGTNYINSSTSVTNAISLLDTATKAAADAASASNTEDGYLQAFVGKTADGSEMPTYSSVTQVTQSSSLESAIGQLDASIGADVTTGAIITNTNTVNANIQAIADFIVNDANEISVTNSAVAVTDTIANTMLAKWIVWVQETATPANVSAYEIFAASNGTTVDFTRFGILKLGATISGVVVSATINGAGIQVSASAGVNVNVRIKRVAAI